MIKFACMTDCSDCCIYREYYPSSEFGKIGVLLMPAERDKIKRLASEKEIEVRILPRLAVGDSPSDIIAYQMMGKNNDGDLCPFLDVEGSLRSPHGGLQCKIYEERPLACNAYPVIDADGKKATLDKHCKFCKQYSTKSSLDGLQQELESLTKIQSKVKANPGQRVWRYATATGKEATLPEGWILDS